MNDEKVKEKKKSSYNPQAIQEILPRIQEKSRGRGRPNCVTPELALAVCNELSSGKTLSQILEENPTWPSREAFYNYQRVNEEFDKMYTQAKRFQVDAMVDEAIRMARDRSKDCEIVDGKKVYNTAGIMRDGLIISSLKWYASKVYPKVWGEKVVQELTGLDGAALIPTINISIKEPKRIE